MFALLSQAKDPIWHTVSCACDACIAADELWINRYGYTLRYGKRPLFARNSTSNRG